ncbi:MAG: T9SS type A sorting domain-containing protein [Ignavibacteria bacterium]
MKKLNLHFKVLLLISAFLISSQNIYSQWTIAGDLEGLLGRPTGSVVDGNTAFVTGGETINATYKTTNGGANWIHLNTSSFRIFWSIWAKDANTVFAGANGNSSVGADTVKLYKTTNGGINWTVIQSNQASIPTFTGIKFSNSIPSFGIGVSGAPDVDFYIYKTRDGGNTWTKTQVTGFSGYNCALGSLIVIDSLFYAHGVNGTSPAIIITTDGGVTWNLRELGLPFTGFSTNGIAFKDDKLTGLAGNTLPIIARTTNGGLNWVNIDVGNGVTSANCQMRWIQGTNTCYLTATDATNGGVLKSTNGGLNWTQMTTSGLGIYRIDTKLIGSNVYGYANSYSSGFFGGNQVLKVTDMIVGINQTSEQVPEGYELSQNYPNPFNPATNLEFGISKLGFVSLKIYDMLGKEVATLVNANLNPGTYKYNYDASFLSSGVYFYKLAVDGNVIDTKRMVLLK